MRALALAVGLVIATASQAGGATPQPVVNQDPMVFVVGNIAGAIKVVYPPLVDQATMDAWALTAQCESGSNWHLYPHGGLGLISWAAYGGLEFAPTASAATPEQQVYVALRIQRNPPDVNKCEGAW